MKTILFGATLAIAYGCIFGLAWTSALALFSGPQNGKITVEFLRYKEGYVEFALFCFGLISFPFFSWWVMKRLTKEKYAANNR